MAAEWATTVGGVVHHVCELERGEMLNAMEMARRIHVIPRKMLRRRAKMGSEDSVDVLQRICFALAQFRSKQSRSACANLHRLRA